MKTSWDNPMPLAMSSYGLLDISTIFVIIMIIAVFQIIFNFLPLFLSTVAMLVISMTFLEKVKRLF